MHNSSTDLLKEGSKFMAKAMFVKGPIAITVSLPAENKPQIIIFYVNHLVN